MTRTIVLTCALPLALLAALSGCGGAATQAGPAPPLTVSGSGSTSKLIEILDREGGFGTIELSFLEGTDSGGGIAAVVARAADLGAVSRSPKPGELAPGVVYRPFAEDGIAFVGDDARVTSLTRGQLLRAFSGKVTNWRQLGGANRPIVLLVRDEDESVTQQLRGQLFGEDFRFAPTATVLSDTGDMNEALARTAGALGFTSYGSLVATRTGLTPLGVDGRRPGVAALERRRYPFTRTLGVVFRLGATTSALSDLLTGPGVAARLRDLGYAPIS